MIHEIQGWADLLNESEAKEQAFDEACKKRADECNALEAEEVEKLNEDEINTEWYGLTEAEVDAAAEEVKEEEEDEIDFGAYGVNEADDREPVSHTLDPIGVKASTASLKAQDKTQIGVDGGATVTGEVIKLAEAVAKLSEAIDKKDEKKLVTEGAILVDPSEPGSKKIVTVEDLINALHKFNPSDKIVWCDGESIPYENWGIMAMWNSDYENSESSDNVSSNETFIRVGDVGVNENLVTEEDPTAALDDEIDVDAEVDKKFQRARELADKIQRSGSSDTPATKADVEELKTLLKDLNVEFSDIVPLSRTRFAPATKKFVDFEDKDGNTTQHYTATSTAPDGSAGETYSGLVPGFNADVDPHDHSNRQQNRIKADREEELKGKMDIKVPERGKDWGWADWNLVMSNFDEKEKKELMKSMLSDADPESAAVIKTMFDDLKPSDLAKAWGVGKPAIAKMEWKIFHRMEDALVRVGFLKEGDVAKLMEKAQENVKRYNEEAVKQGLKTIDAHPSPAALHRMVVIKMVNKFAAKATEAKLQSFINWLKAFSMDDQSKKINNKLSLADKKRYDELRDKVIAKTASEEEKKEFELLVAKKKGEDAPALANEAEDVNIEEAVKEMK